MDETEIIALLETRTESAIQAMSDQYGSYCHYIANSIVRSKEDAEECVNDVLLGAWNTIPPTKPKPLSTYLYRLSRNTALKKYRSKTAQKRNNHNDVALDELADVLASKETPEMTLLAEELSQYFNAFLETMDRENRKIFMLRYWFYLSPKEIGEKLNMKPNTVNVRLKRTREKLKKFLVEKEVLV